MVRIFMENKKGAKLRLVERQATNDVLVTVTYYGEHTNIISEDINALAREFSKDGFEIVEAID